MTRDRKLPIFPEIGAERQVNNMCGVVKLEVAIPLPAQSGAIRVEPVTDDGRDVCFDF